MEQLLKLCDLADLDNPGSAAFDAGGKVDERWDGFEVFVVRLGDAVKGFINACPHTSGPLDWTPGQFLNSDKQLIQCSTHHALFTPNDGLCLSGPCAGQSLVPVPLEIKHGEVWLLSKA